MGIHDINRLLKSNRLLFEIRRDRALRQRFLNDMETVMDEYGLTEEEKDVWRNRDIKRLAELGVHPYMIPQFSRLFYGSAYNHNNSEAAEQYRRAIVEQAIR